MPKTRAILLNSDFDLDILPRRNPDGLIISGLRIGESEYQQQTLILLANKGEVKANPLVGVGLNTHLLDDGSPDELLKEVREQFRSDGMTVRKAEMINGTLKVDAHYNTT